MSDLVVVKANSLIEANYRLSIDEVRILALTIGTMNPNSNQKSFDFTVADFVREFPEISMDNAYKQIQAAVKRIYERSVHTEDEERVTDFRWVSSRTYFKNEGRFRIVMTDEVMPYLTQLKGQFTPYQLRNIAYFNSVYAIRIYELCAQYKSLGEREITVEDLKKWLQVEDKYPRYNSFNQRVLDPAINEINKKSDLFIEFEPIKRGRAVVAIKFQINQTKQEAKSAERLAKSRKIHGVYQEIPRPAVAKNTPNEASWANDNLKQVKQQMRELGLIKSQLIDDYRPIPTAWLKVLKKYYSITDRYSAREISDELKERENEKN